MSVTPIEYGGCVWPVDPACLGEKWELLDPEVQERALRLASDTMQMLTAGRVGGCPITLRPSPQRGSCFVPHSGFSPGVNVSGHWVNNCGVPAMLTACEVALPAPVGRVDEVRIDGAVVPLSDFRVDNGRYLVWQGDGECPFPLDQDMNLPDTEPGTFSVTYLNAYPVDAMGAYAVGLLAMEFANACSGSKCRLPSGVTSIVRNGISMEVRSGSFPDGLTGIREIDAYITKWNPRGVRQATGVYSPDLTRFRSSREI